MLMYLCIYILYVDVSMYMAMSIYIISLQVFSKVADRYRQVQTTALWDAACHWEHSSSLTRAAFEPASIANQPLSARQPWHGELAAAVPVRDMRTGMMPVLGLDYSLACCLIEAVALFSCSFSTFRSSFKACTASVLPSARAATPAGGAPAAAAPPAPLSAMHCYTHTGVVPSVKLRSLKSCRRHSPPMTPCPSLNSAHVFKPSEIPDESNLTCI